MSHTDYDITSPESLKNFAYQLKGKSLSDIRSLPPDAYKVTNKGALGSMVEEYFYEYKPGSNLLHEPDFLKAGVELKVTGVLPARKSKEVPYVAKERLSLGMMNYLEIDQESWETSSFLKKCRLMLLLFYLYNKDTLPADSRFVLDPLLWEFPHKDLEIIERDWLLIQSKIRAGKAHELSEGDTMYLGAARKGSGGTKERLREQPYSEIRAKARAFSLKKGYMDSVVARHWKNTEESVLLKTVDDSELGIEERALAQFNNLAGVSIVELMESYGMQEHSISSKGLLSSLSTRILGTKKKVVPEFEKASIILKTVRLSKKGRPKEAMSFPNFNFIELSQESWVDSNLNELLTERKFFFVVFQYDENDVLRFKKAFFWNMPYRDRLIAEKAWIRTKDAIITGELDYMPKISDDSIIHVRPHGANKNDVLPLPNGEFATKRCFWLNQTYIQRVIEEN